MLLLSVVVEEDPTFVVPPPPPPLLLLLAFLLALPLLVVVVWVEIGVEMEIGVETGLGVGSRRRPMSLTLRITLCPLLSVSLWRWSVCGVARGVDDVLDSPGVKYVESVVFFGAVCASWRDRGGRCGGGECGLRTEKKERGNWSRAFWRMGGVWTRMASCEIVSDE